MEANVSTYTPLLRIDIVGGVWTSDPRVERGRCLYPRVFGVGSGYEFCQPQSDPPELGVYYQEAMLKKRAYISQIAFYSDAPLFLVHPVFGKIANVVSKEVHNNFGKFLPYEATGIALNYDLTASPLGPAPFNIQRRDGMPFSDNKYFSVAPVRTKIHMELLEQVEAAAMEKT